MGVLIKAQGNRKTNLISTDNFENPPGDWDREGQF